MAVLKTKESNVICGVGGTYTHTVTVAGPVHAAMRTTINPSSSVVLTIAQTGSTSVSVSSASPGSTQTHIDLQKTFNCAVSDVITLTIVSSAAVDNQLNNVKTVATVNEGLS